MKRRCVVGAYIVKDNRILLIVNNRFKRWVPVGGMVDQDELPEKTVLREVKEETNLDVTIYPPVEMKGYDAHVTPLYTPFRMQLIKVSEEQEYIDFVYFCKADTFEVKMDETELDDIRWFTEDEVKCSEEFNGYPIFPHVRYLSKQALDFFKNGK